MLVNRKSWNHACIFSCCNFYHACEHSTRTFLTWEPFFLAANFGSPGPIWQNLLFLVIGVGFFTTMIWLKHCWSIIYIYAFTIEVWWNFDKMQITFKAITRSSGYAFWWERTTLHSMETVVWRLPGSLRKYRSWTTYLLQYTKVPYIT